MMLCLGEKNKIQMNHFTCSLSEGFIQVKHSS
jgi:hypothetical protein